MSFTALRTSTDDIKSAYHEVTQEVEGTPTVTASWDYAAVIQPTRFMSRRIAGTMSAMMALYILGFCIAAAHFAMNTYLDGKRIDIDTSLPQSWASTIALVLVNTFRLTLCSCLGVAFTQMLWYRLGVKSMRVGEFDRLQHLQTDLRALLHPRIHRVVPILSIVAGLGWLITFAMILPPGSLIIVSKDFISRTEKRMPSFDAAFRGDGTWGSMLNYSLGGSVRWQYTSTKQSVLTTAKATLMTRDVLSTVSPCGQNCTFMMTFYGPTVKCNTTTLNEIGLIPESASDTYRAPIYSGGWSTVNDRGLSQSASLVPGWVLPDGASETSRKDRPDTFFVARHELATQHPVSAITNTSSYPRTTYLTSCKLHRGIYSLNTVYSKGQRNLRLTTDARESLDSLWHMTEENIESLRLPDPPINVEVTNLFALADSLVQALTGEYYNHSVIRRQDLLKPKPWRPDPRLGYLHANQTIIADTGFNKLSSKIEPASNFVEQELDLDLSEAKINEALQNITLSVMYTLNWWSTPTNVTQTLRQNIFSFSSRPRLVVPYAASLLLSIPFLVMGLRTLRLNGTPFAEPGFVQTLVETAMSEELRSLVTKESNGDREKNEDLKEAKIRYGRVSATGHGRKTIALESEIAEIAATGSLSPIK